MIEMNDVQVAPQIDAQARKHIQQTERVRSAGDGDDHRGIRRNHAVATDRCAYPVYE